MLHVSLDLHVSQTVLRSKIMEPRQELPMGAPLVADDYFVTVLIMKCNVAIVHSI